MKLKKSTPHTLVQLVSVMPAYDYFCAANQQTIEVRHSIHDLIQTWGELCRLANCDLGNTSEHEPVTRRVSAPMVMKPTSDSDYKNLGLTKLVKRDQGVYENVTAKDGEPRIVHR